METKEQIVSFLKDKYHPIAILLHGSRSVNKERPHSDLDIIMLFDKEVSMKGYREEVNGADVEWKASTLPIKDNEIISTFDVCLQFEKILGEANGEGSDLLRRAQVEYEKGPKPYTQDETKREKQFY